MDRAASPSSSGAESAVLTKEAVEGVLAVGGLSAGHMEEATQDSEVEAESGTSRCVMSFPTAEETREENSSSEGREGGNSVRSTQ